MSWLIKKILTTRAARSSQVLTDIASLPAAEFNPWNVI
jgi:hypothetical protein